MLVRRWNIDLNRDRVRLHYIHAVRDLSGIKSVVYVSRTTVKKLNIIYSLDIL